MGGGMDIDLTPRIAVRVLQADWLRTQLPNGASNVQNSLQLGAGIVWHLP
jgi:peptidoglycan-associated lipoprotein